MITFLKKMKNKRCLSASFPVDNQNIQFIRGTHGVMVIITGNRHDDTSSNPGQGFLHFT